jgi:AcrR family transcriptional regulator
LRSEGGTTRDASDDRIANRLRNREHVIDTFIELVKEGKEGKEGNLDELIERSGVARRSIYRYFDDLSDLSMQALWRFINDAAEDAVPGNPGVGPLLERISTFAAIRNPQSRSLPRHMRSDYQPAAVSPMSMASKLVSLWSATLFGCS